MRVARGACWVIVVALAAATGFALLDAVAQFPSWVRGLALAFWLTGVGVLGWQLILRRWRVEPSPKDANRRASEELPGNLKAATAASLSLVACLLAGTLLPGAGESLRRIAMPWHRPAASPYRVVITSGDAVIRRGSSITLTAYAEKTEGAPSPISATFVFRASADAPETRSQIVGDAAAFKVTRSGVSTDFEYRVEVGGAASDWFAVSVLDPVEIADGTTTEIHPPKYAAALTKRTQTGFTAVEGHQFGTAEFRFRFTQAAASAVLEFRADAGALENVPITLAGDRTSAIATVRLKQNGTLKLVTLADANGKKLRTETTAAIRVKPDATPRFELVSGLSPRPAIAVPGSQLHIQIAATDDFAISAAVLECLGHGESKPTTHAIPLDRGLGVLDFDTTGQARAGETLRFRVKVFDSRRLEEGDIKPQEAVYPESGWASVRMDATAPSLEAQEIIGRRDAVRDALDSALTEIRSATEAAEILATETADKATLAVDHVVRLNDARDAMRKAAELLGAASQEAGLNPELRSWATATRTLADTNVRSAEEAFRRATTDKPTARAIAIATAARHLSDAGDRLGELAARNDRLARDRLDRRALLLLAADHTTLAGDAETTAAAELLTRENELLARFRALLAESEPLRNAADAAKQQQFDRLAAVASDLATGVRELNTNVRRLHAETRAGLVADLVTRQNALSTQASALLARIEVAARLANVTLPKAEEFRLVPELISAEKNLAALTEMARLALGLDAVAAAFEKSATDRADTRVAARQLGQWQDDLRTRFANATAGKAANFPSLPAPVRTAFLAEQAALRSAVAALPLPPDAAVKAIRTAVLEDCTNVEHFLKADGLNADTAMRAASIDLGRLADRLPAIPDRLARTRPEFDKVWREQEAIFTEVERLTRATDAALLPKKLTALAERQGKQIAAIALLDLPGLDMRRGRTTAALTAAAGDLQDALAQDALASQLWAKRELERLKSILFDNVQPPDDRADELTRRLESTLKAVEAFGPNPTTAQLSVPAASLQDLLKQIDRFPATPEAGTLLADAREAVRIADSAFRDGTKPDELLRKLRAAFSATGKLADRLTSAESDLDRLRRLAINRRKASSEAKKLLDAKASPNAAASAEATRQIAREFDELTYTRTGISGQLPKKRLLDLYAKWKEHATPDRLGGAQAALADGLEELAALTADIGELTLSFDRNPPPAVASEADNFLPSRSLALIVRELAQTHRGVRTQLNELGAEVMRRTQPTDTRPLTVFVELAKLLESPGMTATRQQARAAELLGSVGELVRTLEYAARDVGIDEPAGKVLLDAAETATAAGKLLKDAAVKATEGKADDAASLRAEAEAQLRASAGKVAGAGPPLTMLRDLDPETAAIGDALLRAELAMRQATRELGVKPDVTAAAKAMRSAGSALSKSATGISDRLTAR